MKKVLHWIDEYLEEVLLVAALAAMAVIMGIQVFSRYVLSASLSWSEELTRYIFIWAGFLSVSYCTKKCISIKIEQFVALFPRRGKAVFKVVNHTLELILFFYLIPFAWKYLMSAVANGQTSPAMGIPMYYVQAAPLVGFILCAVRVEKPFDRLGNSGIPLFIGYIALYHYTQAVGNSPEPVKQRRTMPYAGDQKDDK